MSSQVEFMAKIDRFPSLLEKQNKCFCYINFGETHILEFIVLQMLLKVFPLLAKMCQVARGNESILAVFMYVISVKTRTFLRLAARPLPPYGVVADHVEQCARDHRKSRWEENQGSLRSGRQQKDDHVHGRPEHAGQGHLRVPAPPGTDQAMARLRFLVRQTEADHKTCEGGRWLRWSVEQLSLTKYLIFTFVDIFSRTCICYATWARPVAAGKWSLSACNLDSTWSTWRFPA